MFVNTLALRNYPAGNKTFREFLREVRETSLKAFENQDYQFEELVEKLVLRRDLSRNPLCDVMFALQNMDMGKGEIGGLRIAPYEYKKKTSKLDLTLIVFENEHELNLEFGNH
jgi:fengycin family lipopeptide synthetase D